MRPKSNTGQFLPDFDPFKWGDHFTEGKSWHYTWSEFHDPVGLSKLMGGIDPFLEKMDELFALTQVFHMSYFKRGDYHFEIARASFRLGWSTYVKVRVVEVILNKTVEKP